MELSEVRDTTKSTLLTIFGKCPKFEQLIQTNKNALITAIEREIYNQTIISLQNEPVNITSTNPIVLNVYNAIAYNILINLDPESSIQSNYLINGLLDGKINPKTIGKLRTIDLAPDKTQEIVNHINIRKNQKIETKTVKIYKCRICGENETTTRSIQLRAADEASNTEVTCANCKNVWII
jgi:DNA-directed RNA polymerase subunit M/transcription elongation factor TFIIS